MVSADRISTPPIVGVPFFSIRCRSGPSSRIGWPCRCTDRSQRISGGPRMKLTTSAVRQAAPERNVM